MPRVIERWILPAPNNKPNLDVVHLDDSTYCWAEHNTNNFDIDTYLLADLVHDPQLDSVLLDIIQNGGAPDIIGPTLIGQPNAPFSVFVDDDDDDDCECGNCSICGFLAADPAPRRRATIDIDEPKNNDGRTHCYKCGQPIKLVGGGMYQVCGNQGCAWHDN